jgi:hypothetical protein
VWLRQVTCPFPLLLTKLEDSIEPLRLNLYLVLFSGLELLAQSIHFSCQLLIVFEDALNLVKAPFMVLCSLHEALQVTNNIIYVCPHTKAGL